jgi:hypothetical protein
MMFNEYGAVSGKRTLKLSNPAPVQRVAGISTRNTKNWYSKGKVYTYRRSQEPLSAVVTMEFSSS